MEESSVVDHEAHHAVLQEHQIPAQDPGRSGGGEYTTPAYNSAKVTAEARRGEQPCSQRPVFRFCGTLAHLCEPQCHLENGHTSNIYYLPRMVSRTDVVLSFMELPT